MINLSVYKKISSTTGKISWYCTFTYKDWQGKRHQKKKEGFKTQKDAKQFEVDFLASQATNPHIKFSNLVEHYLTDREKAIKLISFNNKKRTIKNHIEPYFKNMELSSITPAIVRKWQLEILDKKLADSTTREIHSQLSAIFNYAIKFYKLPQNPCLVTGVIGSLKQRQDKLRFYTTDQYKTFRNVIDDFTHKVIFDTLYYSGIRIGELLALTPADILFKTNTISINKGYELVDDIVIIDKPKTLKSIRVLTMPIPVMDNLNKYIKAISPIKANQRIFEYKHDDYIRNLSRRYAEKAHLPYIGLHGFRHSHASLLIHEGFSAITVRDRLGHETVEMTLNRYGHLFPNQQKDIAEKLGHIFVDIS